MAIRESNSKTDDTTPIERVQNHSLPDHILPLIEEYEDIVGDRHRFLWKWAHHLFPKFTLSSVPDKKVAELQDGKLVGLMFVSVLDDTAEKHNDRATFEEAARIPFEHQYANPDRAGVDRDILAFADDLWTKFAPTIENGPRATEFEDVVRFDLKQVVNAMEYSCLANNNLEFNTLSQLETYDAHNMMLFGFTDIDLVHSPAFNRSDLTSLRQVIECTQRMVRIGNWITTWERELHEGDFTSGVVTYAHEHDIVSADELYAARNLSSENAVEPLVEAIKAHDIEEVFLQQWREELATARSFEDEIASVDVPDYLEGIETVMDYHLASRGLK